MQETESLKIFRFNESCVNWNSETKLQAPILQDLKFKQPTLRILWNSEIKMHPIFLASRKSENKKLKQLILVKNHEIQAIKSSKYLTILKQICMYTSLTWPWNLNNQASKILQDLEIMKQIRKKQKWKHPSSAKTFKFWKMQINWVRKNLEIFNFGIFLYIGTQEISS